MNKQNRTVVVLLILALAATLCGCFLWGIVWNGGAVNAILGAAVSLFGVLVLIVLLCLFKRWSVKSRQQFKAAQDELERAKEKVEEARIAAQKEMESYRSTLSHSLRMPVSIIQGYADLLAGGMVKDPETQKEYLQKISQRTQYLVDVMRRQRNDEGLDRSKIVYTKVDLLELVHQAAKDMQTAAAAKMVNIQVLSAEESLVVPADDYLINRVIYNLLENALKYMGRPGTVTIRVLRRGDQASVLVQDDGLGLAASEAEEIFEKNYQGSNRAGGHGFGLYLVKQAVEAHGGTVSAQCAPGRGMGITFNIPLHAGTGHSGPENGVMRNE